ncbi:MAG: response regulator transcription factor [Chloroflexota bacterium]
MFTKKKINELTRRELEILGLIARGWRNRQIAEYLQVKIRTVKYHTTNIYSKLGVKSRSEAIAWAWKHGITQDNR